MRNSRSKVSSTQGWVALLLAAVAFGSATSYAPALQAAEKSYLDQLSQEVEKGGAAVDGSTKSRGEGAAVAEPKNRVVVGKEASFVQFEQALAGDHQSTHNLYLKLDDKKRQMVYADYQEKGDWASVTRKVLQLLYGI